MCAQVRSRPAIYYGWWIVAICSASLIVAVGAMFFALPVFLKPLANEFGWTRAEVSGGISALFLSSALTAPLVGKLVTRHGPRRIMIPAAGLAGLSLILSSLLNTLWQFYAVRFLMGVAYGALTFVPVTVTLSRWFVRKRGRAIGAALTGGPLGGLLFTVIAAFLIDSLGWRLGFAVLGATVLIVLLPLLVLFLRDDPSDLGLAPDGAAPIPNPTGMPVRAAEPSLKAVFMSRPFWLLTAVFLVVYSALLSMIIHQFAFITDLGYAARPAALLISGVLAVSVVGGLSFGWASDRLSPIRLSSLCFALGALGVSLLLGSPSVAHLVGYAILFGLAFGGTGPLLALVVTRCFGVQAFGLIFGFYQGMVSVAAVVGPALLGSIYDATASYGRGFWFVLVEFAVSALLVLFVAGSANAVDTPS